MPYPKDLPPLAADRPLPVPVVRAGTLPNGLSLWTVPRGGVPLVSVRLVVRGGLSLDPEGSPGLAALLASALREGTSRRSSAELAALAQEAGGELETSAGPDSVTIAVSGLAAGLPAILEVVSDVVLRPAFPAAGVARAAALAHEELETNESEPSFLAARAFARSVYGTHPYGTVSPTATSIDALTPHVLHAAAASRLRPERSLLLVVGDVDAGEVTALATHLLGGWEAEGEPPPPVPAPVPPPGPRRIEALHRPGSVQTNLVVGTLGLTRRDPDAYPLDLAMTIYGRSFTSRLVQNLREEKGYTYSPGAGASWTALPGTVRSFAAVRNEVTGAALNEILYEMERMGSTDPTDEEMDRARRRNAGAQAVELETNGSVSAELAALWLAGLAPEELARYAGALATVTKGDVRRVSRRFLATGRARIVAVGDLDVIRSETSSFGDVVEVGADR